MARYLVSARIKADLSELRKELDSDSVQRLRPFGPSLDYSLRNARLAPDGRAVWEELDYCNPPLAQERRAVLNRYFSEIETTPVKEGDGWSQISQYPSLWKSE